MIDPEARYTDAECEDLFGVLFPNGFSGAEALTEIAPAGWAQSTLRLVFHPTLDQVHSESVQLHRNLASWPLRDKERRPRPEPTREEAAAQFQEIPIDVEREAGELVGSCLWDIFSNGHDVVGLDGRTVDIGSFRGAAGFIADQLNRQTGEWKYDYLDFYMGTIWISQRADLTPVYEMIFGRLKKRLLNWRYRFRELCLVRFDSVDDPYSETNRQIAKLEAELKEGHRQAIEDSKQDPPPATVLAYQNVYGEFPHGWPPWQSPASRY